MFGEAGDVTRVWLALAVWKVRSITEKEEYTYECAMGIYCSSSSFFLDVIYVVSQNISTYAPLLKVRGRRVNREAAQKTSRNPIPWI